jgi:aspartyl-tRNA(Asn)/glutamyl-tRNA(Gln) amidotransferase subunit C
MLSMSLDDTTIRNIAYLARLALKSEELPAYRNNMKDILRLIEEMNDIDTENIEPLAHPVEISARLRADEVTETDHREDYQEIAPQVENGFYLVPKVIE